MFLFEYLIVATILVVGLASDSGLCRGRANSSFPAAASGSNDVATSQQDRSILDICDPEPLASKSNTSKSCTYKNHTIPLNEYFHDGCETLCYCAETELICREKKCPLADSLQNIDPDCVIWQKLPVDFVPHYPNCCQQDAVCISNGSCVYETGESASSTLIENWAELPETLSGCERKCYCEQSRFECNEGCPVLRVTRWGAPGWTSDEPEVDEDEDADGDKNIRLFDCDRTISVRKSEGDSCCIEWACVDRKELEDSLRIVFVGDEFIELEGLIPDGVLRLQGNLRASVGVLRNSTFVKSSEQIFRKNNVFVTQKIETKLENLQADTDQELVLKIELVNYNLTLNWTRIEFRTNPKSVQFASGLRAIASTSDSIEIEWRSLTDYDLQLFAGVRLEFKEIANDNSSTPFLETSLFVNHNNNRYRLRNLNANRTYLVRLVMVSGTGHDSIVARDYLQAKTSAETHQNAEVVSEYTDWTINLLIVFFVALMLSAAVFLVRYKRKYKARISSTTTTTTMMSSLTTF